MKQRLGFVSNSSSSSFVITFDKPHICPTCGQSTSIIRAVESSKCCDTELKASGKEDVINGLNYYFYSDFYEEEKETLKKKIENIPPDTEIAYISVSTHDEGVREVLYSNNVKIIWCSDE